MGRNVAEILMGAVVLFVALSFIIISYKSGNVSVPDGYIVAAKFREVGSLSVGSDVRISGIKVGVVAAQTLDPEQFTANVSLRIRNDIKIPNDSSATVTSDGLLGSKYVAILPGGDEEYLQPNQVMSHTQDAVNLEALLGKFAFGGSGAKTEQGSGEQKNKLQ
jgi:phospholipid/cholesterol/gamma-HCH transport system substrate-binding protein